MAERMKLKEMDEGHKMNNQHGNKTMEARNKGLTRNQILLKKYCTFNPYESILLIHKRNWSEY